MNKEEYINKFLELYDNSEWIYETMLQSLKISKEEIEQGHYSKENMRKVFFEDILLEFDGLFLKCLYDQFIGCKKESELVKNIVGIMIT